MVATPAILRGTDRFGGPYTMGRLGVASGEPVVVRRGPFEAMGYAVVEVVSITRAMADGLRQVVTGARDLNEMGGPVKIAQVSGQAASLGLASLVTLVALLSINLGFINLLPIPMLDGGHLMLYAVEAFRRRPLGRRFTEWAFMSGAALMLTLMLVLTWNDLAQVGVWRHLAALAN
jgi:regulator of sigma E protease